MKKAVKETKKILVSLSNDVTMEIVINDAIYMEKYLDQLRSTGTLLGLWVNKIEVI
jgi:hypothetical protein